jgi:hypothetical protein
VPNRRESSICSKDSALDKTGCQTVSSKPKASFAGYLLRLSENDAGCQSKDTKGKQAVSELLENETPHFKQSVESAETEFPTDADNTPASSHNLVIAKPSRANEKAFQRHQILDYIRRQRR